MAIRLRGATATLYSYNLWNTFSINPRVSNPVCAKRPPPPPPSENGDGADRSKGEKYSTDWDKAWSSFRKRGKKTLFSDFSPDKYVSWNPRRSEFPLSEEVDPIKRTERSNLTVWTSTGFTLGLAVLIVTLLLLYTLSVPLK